MTNQQLADEQLTVSAIREDTRQRLAYAEQMRALGASTGARESIHYCETILRILNNYEKLLETVTHPRLQTVCNVEQLQFSLPAGAGKQ